MMEILMGHSYPCLQRRPDGPNAKTTFLILTVYTHPIKCRVIYIYISSRTSFILDNEIQKNIILTM